MNEPQSLSEKSLHLQPLLQLSNKEKSTPDVRLCYSAAGFIFSQCFLHSHSTQSVKKTTKAISLSRLLIRLFRALRTPTQMKKDEIDWGPYLHKVPRSIASKR
jgi:hypothetical protein